jgi:hypothetical protein
VTGVQFNRPAAVLILILCRIARPHAPRPCVPQKTCPSTSLNSQDTQQISNVYADWSAISSRMRRVSERRRHVIVRNLSSSCEQLRSEGRSLSMRYCANDCATCYPTSSTAYTVCQPPYRFLSASNRLANMAKSSSGEGLETAPSFPPFPFPSSSSVGGISGSLGVPSLPPTTNFPLLSGGVTMSLVACGAVS